MTKPVNKSTPIYLPSDLVSVHIATSTISLKKGFPPPICHKLVGFAAIIVKAEGGGVELLTQSDVDGEKHLLTTLANVTTEKDVVNFIPHRFTLPVLRGAAYRTGTPFTPLDPVWFDMGAWFGNGKTTMSDCAVATGLGERHEIDIALALRDGRLGDIEDQLLIDAFSVLCMRMRQIIVEDDYNVELYRTTVSEARKKVRAAVKESDCRKYVSWKGMTSKKRFLLK